jgi:Mce-associated membrane protein
MHARKRGGFMRTNLANAESGSAPTGRHRLSRSIGRAGLAATPVIGTSGGAVVDDDDFDEQDVRTPPEISAEVDHLPDEAVASPPVGNCLRLVIAFAILPTLMVILGGGAGYLVWGAVSAHFMQQASVDSIRAATDGTVALLTYGPDTAAKDLGAARELLTGKFKDSYTMFTRQQVIPDAQTRHVSSVVTVPATAIVRATFDHAVVMVVVNQTFLHDSDPPTSTASDVRVTLDKVGRRWLISDFTPVG